MEFWKKNLYILWGTQFLAMLGMNLIVPFLPFFIRQLGVRDSNELAQWSGLVFAGPFFTAFIATPLWGTLGDKHGKKTMVVRAIVGLGLSQVLIGFSANVYQLFIFRMFQGAISGFIAANLALVSTSTPKEKIGYALGTLQTATSLGTVLGPAIGGVLADSIGYREIFFVVAVLCCIGGIVVFKFVKEIPQQTEVNEQMSVISNVKFMFTHRQLAIIGTIIILSQSAALMIEPMFALFIESFTTNTQYLSTLTGIIIAISGVFMVIASPWWGKRNDILGYKKNICFALSGTGTAYFLHLFVPNLFSLGILRAGLGFARGGILHSLFSQVSLLSPKNRKSGLIGIASSLAVFGNMIGPVSGGYIAKHWGISSAFLVSSFFLFLAVILVWKFFHEVSFHTNEKTTEVIDVVE
jgi:DHA1 family multidrug resistance protein-like MFS transporter